MVTNTVWCHELDFCWVTSNAPVSAFCIICANIHLAKKQITSKYYYENNFACTDSSKVLMDPCSALAHFLNHCFQGSSHAWHSLSGYPLSASAYFTFCIQIVITVYFSSWVIVGESTPDIFLQLPHDVPLLWTVFLPKMSLAVVSFLIKFSCNR